MGLWANQEHLVSSHPWVDRLHPPSPMIGSEPRLLRQKHIQTEITAQMLRHSFPPSPQPHIRLERVLEDVSLLEREGWEEQAESQRMANARCPQSGGRKNWVCRDGGWETRRKRKENRLIRHRGQGRNFKETVKMIKHLENMPWILNDIKSTGPYWCFYQPPVGI